MPTDCDRWVRVKYPRLRDGGFRETSEKSRRYNCIAWAAGEAKRWWWPADPPDAYWPQGVPREETLASFIRAFATLGYAVCADGALEATMEKVAIFVAPDGTPTHMARQLETGSWTSKCGAGWDIEHTQVDAVENQTYGHVSTYLRRRRR